LQSAITSICTGDDARLKDGENEMDFGEAIKALKDGKRISRAGWNGKGAEIATPDVSIQDAEIDPPTYKRSDVPIDDKPPLPPTVDDDQAPSVFLNTVRAQTCYRSLRILVELSSWMLFVVAALCGLVFIIHGLEGTGRAVYLGIGIGVIVLVFGAFLGLACRQASSLLIDIADILIEGNRRKASSPKNLTYEKLGL
jgi:hypothetical protein